MKMIRVHLDERSYSIIVAKDYHGLPAALKRLDLPRHAFVISHASILRRSAAALRRELARHGWRVEVLTIPESETSKSFGQVERLVAALARRSAMHVPLLLALGGGVVGDVTGFVAAIFRRGVPYVQLPTTLLAQVDSAIGGKTGIDVPQAKNLVGAFYQPKLVWNHTGLLKTLPLRQRQSGLAEIIKYGIIADAGLFDFLERQRRACLELVPFAAAFMIERSCSIKARVVSRDERETHDIRATLNFGHTLGHALEAATAYRRWTHGEAVAVGMCAASAMAARLGLFDSRVAERVTDLIRACGLPVRAGGVSSQKVLQAMRLDKKFTHGRPRWILPTRIGHVIIMENVPARLVDETLKAYLR